MQSADQVPRPWHHHRLKLVLGAVAAYLLIAYVFMPQLGKYEARRHPALYEGDRVTHTGTGMPGDPLNISLIGSETDLVRSMHAAGWLPADPLTFKASVRIVVDTVLNEPDKNAPVSNLFLFGRREDFAFEKSVGNSPRQRHHVRLWKTTKTQNDRPVWIGSAAFDVGVELSKETGQVTHHIAKEIDAERDLLLGDLQKAGRIESSRWVEGFHQVLHGRNGGGDLWVTDGRLAEAFLKPLDSAPAK
jgi:hypothetical protein